MVVNFETSKGWHLNFLHFLLVNGSLWNILCSFLNTFSSFSKYVRNIHRKDLQILSTKRQCHKQQKVHFCSRVRYHTTPSYFLPGFLCGKSYRTTTRGRGKEGLPWSSTFTRSSKCPIIAYYVHQMIINEGMHWKEMDLIYHHPRFVRRMKWAKSPTLSFPFYVDPSLFPPPVVFPDRVKVQRLGIFSSHSDFRSVAF